MSTYLSISAYCLQKRKNQCYYLAYNNLVKWLPNPYTTYLLPNNNSTKGKYKNLELSRSTYTWSSGTKNTAPLADEVTPKWAVCFTCWPLAEVLLHAEEGREGSKGGL